MTAPIKILYTIPNFITAGSGQALLNIVQRLDRNRFEPAIAVLKSGGRLEGTIRELGIPLYELPFTVAPRPIHSLPLRIWNAARCFRQYHFTLWHSYHYTDDYTEPLIARVAGAKAWVYHKKNMGWGSRAWRVRTMLASRIAAQNTDMLKQFFADPHTKAKVRLLPRGVDVGKFYPQADPRLGIRSRFGLNTATFLVGCVAHLVPVKGHPTLIQAIAKLPNAHLVLAGKPLDETYVNELTKLCADLDIADRVHFLGDVQDIPAFHAELDVFVLPTLARFRMEGCPVALLEAMACGLPCIATDIPGSRDVIQPDVSGLLVAPEDVDGLARLLADLHSTPERRAMLGAAARQRVLDCYTIEREVAAHEALYDELLRAR